MTTNRRLKKQLKVSDEVGRKVDSTSPKTVEINLIEIPIYELVSKQEHSIVEWEENHRSEAQRKLVDGLFNVLINSLKPMLPEGAVLIKNKYGLMEADKGAGVSEQRYVYAPLKLSYPKRLSDLYPDSLIRELQKIAEETFVTTP